MGFKLREMDWSDLPMVLEWRNQEQVRRNMYTTHVISEDEHRRWFEGVSNDSARRYFVFEEDGAPAGVVGFTEIDPVGKKASWAFYASGSAKRGTGTKMEYCALQYAFSELGLHKLYCEVLSFNSPVVKFHQKFGFREEGVFRDHYLNDDGYHDIHCLAIFEEDWKSMEENMKKRVSA